MLCLNILGPEMRMPNIHGEENLHAIDYVEKDNPRNRLSLFDQISIAF